VVTLVGMTAAWLLSLYIYAFALRACLPRLGHLQAQVLNLAGSAVSNVVPFGGAVGVGATYGIARSWGYRRTTVSVEVAVTGLFNVLTKLALPVLALVALALRRETTPAIVTAAVTGFLVFVGLVVALVMIERSETAATRLGHLGDRVLNGVLAGIGSHRRVRLTGSLVGFRDATFDVLGRKWPQLTASLVGFKLSQFLLLLLCVRAVGSSPTVGWVEVFAAYAFGRILSTIPVTPAGVGFVETGSIAALVALGGDRVGCAAAVLLFSSYIYLLEIPLGAVAWIVWGTNRRWRRDQADQADLAAEA
jgi:uncharacterized membrane protein YbhN (UPF0104 family)